MHILTVKMQHPNSSYEHLKLAILYCLLKHTMPNEGLGAEIEAMQCGHVQWSASLTVLHVGVCPRLNKQLHTQSTVVGEGSIVEGSLTLCYKRVAC